MNGSLLSLVRVWCAFLCLSPLLAAGQTLNINNDIQKVATLTSTTATLAGKAELHVTGTGDPITGSVINLTSPDAWFFLDNIVPSQVASTFLGRVQVNGAAAVLNTNVRVVQFGPGAVVIPQTPTFAAMEVFDGPSFTGATMPLQCYTAYNNTSLGSMKAAIRSFRLKRGYTATIAQQESGGGISVNYVAQDGDLEVGALPATLDKGIAFIRIFPWRWVNKKGIAGDIWQNLNVAWYYDWNISQNSTLDLEYMPIRQNSSWPSLNQDWKARGACQLLGYNEPDQTNQSNLTAAQAIAGWPGLLSTGLRVGAPAVSDGGSSWISSFISQADAASLRVDFVPVHYYRSYSSASDPDGATTQLYNFLKGIYNTVKRPLWVTEFNNGANWTTGPDPTAAQQQATVAKMVAMLDSTPFVERYSLYNWVEDVRRVKWDDGSLTAAGVSYRDEVSALSYTQAIPAGVTNTGAQYAFNGDARDSSGNGHDGMRVGAPTFTDGKYGQSIVLDGATDYVQLPAKVGSSTDFTFSAWVNWSGGANWQRVFDLGADTSKYLFLTPKSSANTLRFAITSGSGEQQLNTTALTAGQWTHVAVTITGTVGKLFVNGVLVNTNPGISINPADIGTSLNYLGKSRFAADPLFNGQLENVSFLPTALTDAQVAAIASKAPFGLDANPVTGTAVKGLPYTDALASRVSGGSGVLSFSKLSGPAWLTVGADGSLTGTPAVSNVGANLFLMSVSDASGASTTGTLQVTVLATAPPLPAITSITVASVQIGTDFSYQITASNSPTSYGASGLPDGLSISAATGLISGAPTVAGVYNIALGATNLGGTGTLNLALTVTAAPVPTPSITSGAVAGAQVGTPFSYQIVGSNSPTSYGASGLPDGLSIDTASGLISGTPTVAGTVSVALSAANTSGTGTGTLVLTVLNVQAQQTVVTVAVTTPQTTVGSSTPAVITVLRTGGDPTQTISVNYTVKGTALNGTDYVLLTGKKKLASGKVSKPIKIVGLGDLGGAAKKTVKVIVTGGTGYTIGTASSAKVKILPGQ